MASAKVMSADVQRIASVLEELIQKLTLLSVVSHQVQRIFKMQNMLNPNGSGLKTDITVLVNIIFP